MSSQPINQEALQWTFGDRLRKVRRLTGESQAQFAETLGVGKNSLAAWELDVNTPRSILAVANRIELAYGIRAAWMLGLDEKTPGPGGPGVSYTTRDSNPEPADSGTLGELVRFPQQAPIFDLAVA